MPDIPVPPTEPVPPKVEKVRNVSKDPLGIRILRKIGQLVVRAYATVILLVLIWTGYTALAYLVRTVFLPTHVPEQFLHWQAKLDTEALRGTEVAGVTAHAPRAPLDHYHQIDRWFQPDPHNGCSSSGCHSPLPHAKRKEVRAFANLHATFLACQTCHEEAAAHPAPVMWVSTTTGQRQEPPALLQLMRALEMHADQVSATPAEIHPTVVRLLRESIEAIGGEPVLDYLVVQIDTSEPGSPVWRQAMRQLSEELPSHARGEYMAKLAPRKSESEQREAAKNLRELTRRYHAAAPEGSERQQVRKEIHRAIVAKPDSCLACHGDEPPRLDFEAAGYSPARVKALRASPIVSMMQYIREGQPFHLPGFMGAPITQP